MAKVRVFWKQKVSLGRTLARPLEAGICFNVGRVLLTHSMLSARNAEFERHLSRRVTQVA
jgi:hypothetical protein